MKKLIAGAFALIFVGVVMIASPANASLADTAKKEAKKIACKECNAKCKPMSGLKKAACETACDKTACSGLSDKEKK